MGNSRHKTETVDMTTGSPGRRILIFALPMIFGNVVQQLYSMVKLCSAWALGHIFGRSALWFAWPLGWAAANWQIAGTVVAKGCGDREALKATGYPEAAYESGKNL